MVRLNKIYTRTGDDGTTGLVGGERVAKADQRIEAYGTVDELNAALGLLPQFLGQEQDLETVKLVRRLLAIQQALFDIGASLATRTEKRWANMPMATQAHVDWLENDIDAMNATLEPLRSFVLPGGSLAVAQFHVARTVCRRAEREVLRLAQVEAVEPLEIKFLNRLSDWLFVAGRFVCALRGESEVLWSPGLAMEKL